MPFLRSFLTSSLSPSLIYTCDCIPFQLIIIPLWFLLADLQQAHVRRKACMNFSKSALLSSKEKATALMAATAYNFNEKRKPFFPVFYFFLCRKSKVQAQC